MAECAAIMAAATGHKIWNSCKETALNDNKGNIDTIDYGHRDSRLDLMRAVAIFFVLIIHSATRYVRAGDAHFIAGWFSAIASAGVPIFLFLSGYLFRTENLSWAYVFRKFQRVVQPFLVFWTLSIIAINRFSTLDYIRNDAEFLSSLILASSWEIYYFIFVIAYAYIISFVIMRYSILYKNIHKITLVFFIFNVLHAIFYEDVIDALGVTCDRCMNLYFYRSPFMWLFYYFLGMSFRTIDRSVWKTRKKVMRAASLTIILLYNSLYVLEIGKYLTYNSINVTLYSVALICFLLTVSLRGALIIFMSEISFYLYLSHYFFVQLLLYITRRISFDYPLLLMLASFGLSFLGPLMIYFFIVRVFKDKANPFIGLQTKTKITDISLDKPGTAGTKPQSSQAH